MIYIYILLGDHVLFLFLLFNILCFFPIPPPLSFPPFYPDMRLLFCLMQRVTAGADLLADFGGRGSAVFFFFFAVSCHARRLWIFAFCLGCSLVTIDNVATNIYRQAGNRGQVSDKKYKRNASEMWGKKLYEILRWRTCETKLYEGHIANSTSDTWILCYCASW